MADRFCGEKLSTTRAPGVATNSQLCSKLINAKNIWFLSVEKLLTTNTIAAKIKPFRLIYGTDGTEEAVVAPALVLTPADTDNVGFCLDYQERAN